MANDKTIMGLEQIIDEKIGFLEKTTGEKVVFEKSNDGVYPVKIDWPNWRNVGFPKILINYDMLSDRVHILHELIHLDNFFVSHYPIVCSSKELHAKIAVFKNIPEDYIVHKIIKEEFNLNPISDTFLDRDSLRNNRSDKELAVDLTNFYFFSEFHGEYKKRFPAFKQNCRRQKHLAFRISQKTIKCVSEIDYKDKESYKKGVIELINIFEPDLFSQGLIKLCTLSKNQGQWLYNN